MLQNIAAISSLIIAIVAVITAVMTIRRTKKNRLIWSYVAMPLMSIELTNFITGFFRKKDGADVFVEVKKPYIVKIKLSKEGKGEIRKDDFEGNHLPVHFGVPVILLIKKQTKLTNTQALVFELRGNAVSIPPCQIKNGHGLEASFMCDGKPTLEMGEISNVDTMLANDPRLLNVKLSKFKEQSMEWFWVTVFWVLLGLAGLGIFHIIKTTFFQ